MEFQNWMEERVRNMVDKDANVILSGLKRLMHHKYSDVILLVSVIAAFGALLAVSAIG